MLRSRGSVQAAAGGLTAVDGAGPRIHDTASDSFYFDSAHLTITGGPYKGNWFFQINETEAVPSAPPKNYAGQYSRNGNNLPSPLKEETVKLLEIIGIFDSD
ncbi:hypothetical protein [Nonomuraea typhae]|uniref:Uncharacterized protein n=1 Tax=Nonomuraea typhae TaxID=2603600 RepID=A0ABW7YWQ3_9ACTN